MDNVRKNSTTKPVDDPPDPLPPAEPEKDGADIRCYRAGYEDGFHFAQVKFAEGVVIGLFVLFTIRVFRNLMANE